MSGDATDNPHGPEDQRKLEQRREQLIGKDIEGVLIHRRGTVWFVKWNNSIRDNVYIKYEYLEKSGEVFKSGMWCTCKIKNMGPKKAKWDRQHPITNAIEAITRDGEPVCLNNQQLKWLMSGANLDELMHPTLRKDELKKVGKKVEAFGMYKKSGRSESNRDWRTPTGSPSSSLKGRGGRRRNQKRPVGRGGQSAPGQSPRRQFQGPKDGGMMYEKGRRTSQDVPVQHMQPGWKKYQQTGEYIRSAPGGGGRRNRNKQGKSPRWNRQSKRRSNWNKSAPQSPRRATNNKQQFIQQHFKQEATEGFRLELLRKEQLRRQSMEKLVQAVQASAVLQQAVKQVVPADAGRRASQQDMEAPVQMMSQSKPADPIAGPLATNNRRMSTKDLGNPPDLSIDKVYVPNGRKKSKMGKAPGSDNPNFKGRRASNKRSSVVGPPIHIPIHHIQQPRG